MDFLITVNAIGKKRKIISAKIVFVLRHFKDPFQACLCLLSSHVQFW